MSGPLVKKGRSFPGLTVEVKVRFVDCPISSVTVIVITAAPNSSGAGVIANECAVFVPANTILVLGTSVGLEELAERTSRLGDSSWINILIGPVEVSSLITRLVKTVIIRGGRSNAAVA